MNLPVLARRLFLGWFASLGLTLAAATPPTAGYFRFPAIHGDTAVFTAEGDLWRAPVAGGAAQRLTTHPGLETNAAISPDGTSVAFSAQYDGPTEVYLMPLAGGLPRRLTYDGESAEVRGWTPDGRVLYSTRAFAGLPDAQLIALDPRSGMRTPVPLAQADEGVYDDHGRVLFFTRYSAQSSHTKRYVGGTAQNIWRLDPGAAEAVQLNPDYKGTSRWPMWWQGLVYFASDRDGTMNLWSMKPDGSDLRQLTRHSDFGVKRPMQQGGRIIYQNGADLFLFDIKAGQTAQLTLILSSDFDQLRETWVTKPADYLTDFNLSPEGNRVALVVRGQVFVAPVGPGRLAEVTRKSGVRYRSASFLPDGRSLLVLSDESGEVEFWQAPGDGVGTRKQLTTGGRTLRMFGLASPDGHWIAHTERNQDLLLFNIETGKSVLVAHSNAADFDSPSLAWSPDSKWLAYALTAASGNTQLQLFGLDSGRSTPVTSDRVISEEPAFSPDGHWLYFLSDRSFNSPIEAPWGPRQPEPVLDRPTKIYALALATEKRFPFQPPDELTVDNTKAEKAGPPAEKDKANLTAAKGPLRAEASIVLDGIITRLWEVPVPSGNYSKLSVTDKHLYVLDREPASSAAVAAPTSRLVAVEIKNKEVEPATVATGLAAYRVSADGKKLLLQQKDDFYVVDAVGQPATLNVKAKLDLGGLKFSYSPRESWRQIFTDAWRLHRDYFYDKNMHGVDWPANLAKHLPLVDRVTDRSELNDLLNYLISELSALHTDARGGDVRKPDPDIGVATLGARWSRDEAAGGYRLDHVYQGDPDFPERLGPLLKPGLGIKNGDTVLEINGMPTLSVPDAAALLRNQAGRQVLLRLKPSDKGEPYSRIVTPLAASEAANLRYDDWEYSRRLVVDKKSAGQVGYVHLRAMGTANYYEWARNYYAAADKGGLILDLRHNRGGNIDSWIMSRLLRPPWMWWTQRDGLSQPNFQNAFRGHLVLLVDAWTASDGETMANGVRHLGLGKIFGTRTWGGGIWLRGANFLVDRGIARAAEFGSYIPGEGWTIEGDGLTPDAVVDNTPVATFRGEDAQLDAALRYLQEKIARDPKHLIPPAPLYPDKTLKQ